MHMIYMQFKVIWMFVFRGGFKGASPAAPLFSEIGAPLPLTLVETGRLIVRGRSDATVFLLKSFCTPYGKFLDPPLVLIMNHIPESYAFN